MTVEVSFVDPVSVSSGIYRDFFVATIRDPEYFISAESFLRIPANSTDSTKIPKMMPDTEFTKKFVAVSDGVGALARTTLFGNYIIHIVFSGAMHFLWGLIHCLQIVAHYSMLDINMPSNAHHTFSIIMSIA